MLAALQTIENPALHLAVHMSMVLSLREGEILGLQPSDLDFIEKTTSYACGRIEP